MRCLVGFKHPWSESVTSHEKELISALEADIQMWESLAAYVERSVSEIDLSDGRKISAVANTPAGRMELIRSYDSTRFGLPRNRGGSAPASLFSGPAQRLLTLRPACSPSRLCDPLHRRLQQLRCLRCCFDCYRVERTSSRAGIHPLWTITFSRRTRLER